MGEIRLRPADARTRSNVLLRQSRSSDSTLLMTRTVGAGFAVVVLAARSCASRQRLLHYAEPDVHLLSRAKDDLHRTLSQSCLAGLETIRREPREFVHSVAQSATGETWWKSQPNVARGIRSIRNPVSLLELSIQLRLIWLLEMAAAVRLLGRGRRVRCRFQHNYLSATMAESQPPLLSVQFVL
jgi:hypothetical protein